MGYNSGTEGQEEAWRQADQKFYKSKGGVDYTDKHFEASLITYCVRVRTHSPMGSSY